MQWWVYAMLGAGGGAMIEVLASYQSILDWQSARKSATGALLEKRPKITDYVDFEAHLWVIILRGVLGAVAAALLGTSGHFNAYVAFGAGCAAPTLVAKFGSIPEIRNQLTGKGDSSDSRNDSGATDHGGVTGTTPAGATGER